MEQVHTTFGIFRNDIVMAVGKVVSGRVTPYLSSQQSLGTFASFCLLANGFKHRDGCPSLVFDKGQGDYLIVVIIIQVKVIGNNSHTCRSCCLCD